MQVGVVFYRVVVGFQLLDPPIVESDCGLCGLSLLLHLFSDICSQFIEVKSGVKLVESVSTARNSEVQQLYRVDSSGLFLSDCRHGTVEIVATPSPLIDVGVVLCRINEIA